ncbi:trypsin eta-like [Teleopsis dalmanni]|uniref:trypsin eta-like n=1 Tax=Teleopsis dalmanni TaxID=139649 RepID=UPI0018CC7EAF|nr:trypsin eta-like [Teleopsis dalmanni]
MCKVQLILSIVIIIAAVVVAAPEGRIIGGEVVDPWKHPYIVSIRYKESVNSTSLHRCAGVVYSQQVVITSAQCIVPYAHFERIYVKAAGNTRTGVDGQLYPVKKWISHEKYSVWTADYDIGVLILEEPFNFKNLVIHPIAIRNSLPSAGKMATIAGWGYREEFGPSSYNLEETQVPIVSSADCNNIYKVSGDEVTERMICAGYVATGGKDACQGDTGGPLVVDDELVGLVSWGRGCARPGYPTVYSLVKSYVTWIDNTIAAEINKIN